ncbi:hypothetical protein BCR33DRAFT_653316, partial [Rhizoclosmatium globosum]
DNQTAIRNCEEGALRPQTKHLDVKYRVLKEFQENGIIRMVYRESGKNKSDILTKGLNPV